ncbi:UDP-N-acetyl glucosamine 2-epimerase [Marinobacter sp. DUT-1]|uniref:UDP-N-acetyl glucosamine 2-epimerase n=1 Tax=Marinobacter sp. DUT-1 TaxID=3412037 RepID=UPI003D173570
MIHILIGTKAQLIKMAPIMRALLDRGVGYNFIHTGQHRETIEDILADFSLPDPDFYLDNGPDIKQKTQVPKWIFNCLKRTGQSSSCWSGRKRGDKDVVLVHGDTLSTVIGALAAKRMGFKCGHVESGLRSFNFLHPFPEELIRVATFRLADILFCPGASAVKNVVFLEKRKKVIDTFGNTMLDATRHAVQASVSSVPSNYGIVSIHRYENIFYTQRLTWIVEKIIEQSRRYPMIFVMHPPTEQRLRDTGLYEKLSSEPGIELRKRFSYFEFAGVLARARFLVTDGGSNQEESSYLGLPCLVMRKSTERTEGVGNNVLLSNYSERSVEQFFSDPENYRKPSLLSDKSPSEIIVKDLESYF